MSKYFAKYLPVEGEMKEGDDVITITGFLQKYDDWVDLQGPTKVKLFLCSRDIQVGDIINDFMLLYREDGELRSIPKLIRAGAYKVIGEISPEATWVKEGMEFDEKEVHRCFVHENVSTSSDPMKRKVQIKGPCGHFH